MSKWLAGCPPGCQRGKGNTQGEGGDRREGEGGVVAMDNVAGKAQRPEERKGRDARGIDGGERTRLFLIFKI